MSKVNRKVNQMLRFRHLGGARAARSLLVAGALVLAAGARSASASTLNMLANDGKEGADCAYALRYVFLLLGYSNGDWAAVAPWLTADVHAASSCPVDDAPIGILGGQAGAGGIVAGGAMGAADSPVGVSAANDFGFDQSAGFGSPDGDVGDDEAGPDAFDLSVTSAPTDFFDALFKYGGDVSQMNESLGTSFRLGFDTSTDSLIVPIPTPEPGSLLLVATGLASSLWKIRTKRPGTRRAR